MLQFIAIVVAVLIGLSNYNQYKMTGDMPSSIDWGAILIPAIIAFIAPYLKKMFPWLPDSWFPTPTPTPQPVAHQQVDQADKPTRSRVMVTVNGTVYDRDTGEVLYRPDKVDEDRPTTREDVMRGLEDLDWGTLIPVLIQVLPIILSGKKLTLAFLNAVLVDDANKPYPIRYGTDPTTSPVS